MITPDGIRLRIVRVLSLVLVMAVSRILNAGSSSPVFERVYPAGARAGDTVSLVVTGSQLETLRTLYTKIPGARCRKLDENQIELQIPADTATGYYDLWAECENGISAPRTFVVGSDQELLETEPNDLPEQETCLTYQQALDGIVINGQIGEPGDQDCFQFSSVKGRRIVIECFAERIDSRLRAVLEIIDSKGHRLAVNRGYYGTEPLIVFTTPADDEFTVRIADLTASGGPEYYYRLELDGGPRTAFVHPCVVQRGCSTQVSVAGWNLNGGDQNSSAKSSTADNLDQVEVSVATDASRNADTLAVRRLPAQAVLESVAIPVSGSQSAFEIGLTDLPVVTDTLHNHTPAEALNVSVPCEISGQLSATGEQDWYSFEAHRGEVLYIESIADRIKSPVDPEIVIFDATGSTELTHFSDEVRNPGGTRLPITHLDAGGRWTVPADGRWTISIRNLAGGPGFDSRRIYRLSLRRQEPTMQLIAIAHKDAASGLNIPRGGRALLDVYAIRGRGLDESICIRAKDLPPGIECPDVWLGPQVSHAVIVVSANDTATAGIHELRLEGTAVPTGQGREIRCTVHGAAQIRSGIPNGWSRLMSAIPMAVSVSKSVTITADGSQPLQHHLYGVLNIHYSPGSVLDVAVDVHHPVAGKHAPIQLTGEGLPDSVANQTTTIPAGQNKGHLSFYLPPTLSPGWYTTVIRAETSVTAADQKAENLVVWSNPVSFEVRPEAFLLEIDSTAPVSARRGETIQVSYRATRRNGFIGKLHTELAGPGVVTDVIGLRGRGETFTGQTDSGSLQIEVNPDAPLGRQRFLRLFTVGVAEDEPVHFGSRFLDLEITE